MRAADTNQPPLKFRKPRIAWSAVCGIFCLLLITLWVRSFHAAECAVIQNANQHLAFSSEVSRIQIEWVAAKLPWSGVSSVEISQAGGVPELETYYREKYGRLGFGVRFVVQRWKVTCPHWFLVCLFAALGTTPWIPWRFSIR